jgi:uncharacterized protein YegP (UPF0339 family)
MRLEIYRDATYHVDTYDENVRTEHQWRWRVRATNGRILADSGEAYGRLRNCAHGASLVTGIKVPAKSGDWVRGRYVMGATGSGAWRITVSK